MAMHKKLFAVLLDQHFERTAPAEQRAALRDYFAKPKELRGDRTSNASVSGKASA